MQSMSSIPVSPEDKIAFYAQLNEQIKNVVAGERDLIANAANCAAMLFHTLPNINWAGFYFLKGDDLVLGPFQGKPACVRIAMGRGVCGTAAMKRQTLIVPDVSAFPAHIACDATSKSEIVIPLIFDARLLAVLDIDAPITDRFDVDDAAGLEKIAMTLLSASDVNRERDSHPKN